MGNTFDRVAQQGVWTQDLTQQHSFMLQHHMPLCLDISRGTLKATQAGSLPTFRHPGPITWWYLEGFLPLSTLTPASPSSFPPQPPCTAARGPTLLTAAPGENTRHQPPNASGSGLAAVLRPGTVGHDSGNGLFCNCTPTCSHMQPEGT